MNDTSSQHVQFHLDRAAGVLCDARGRRFDISARRWGDPPSDAPNERLGGGRAGQATGQATGQAADHVISLPADAIAAATWLQRESGHPLRVPVGVIGPREATLAQLAAAEHVGAGLADMGVGVLCGGRHGVMQAVCEGVRRGGGVAIGLLPDTTPELANAYLTYVIPTGLGEARNAVIARAAFCLVVIGDSYGTLSEVALGLQFGKHVYGLEGAAQVEGVLHFNSAADVLEAVALRIIEFGD
jgi:uncharacterized protein (TIGR00725 family)